MGRSPRAPPALSALRQSNMVATVAWDLLVQGHARPSPDHSHRSRQHLSAISPAPSDRQAPEAFRFEHGGAHGKKLAGCDRIIPGSLRLEPSPAAQQRAEPIRSTSRSRAGNGQRPSAPDGGRPAWVGWQPHPCHRRHLGQRSARRLQSTAIRGPRHRRFRIWPRRRLRFGRWRRITLGWPNPESRRRPICWFGGHPGAWQLQSDLEHLSPGDPGGQSTHGACCAGSLGELIQEAWFPAMWTPLCSAITVVQPLPDRASAEARVR